MLRRALPVLAIGVLLCGGAAAAAQDIYFPYYGKNRVLYERFAWKSYPTEHFRIYFYTDDERLLKNVADFAESAYRHVSAELKHDLSESVPLLYYTTSTDFEQSNVFQISEGVLGVAEPVLFRIGVHGDMPEDELQSLIAHELAHIFSFDILWGSQGGVLTAVTQPPLWTFEGLSEYMTGKWSSWSDLITRDAVLNDRIPEFSESGDIVSRYPLPRDPAYDFGHAAYEYMLERYGPGAIRDLWRSLKGAPLLGRRDPFEKTFKTKARDFSQDFKRYLRARFKDYLARENPEDYSIPLGPEFPINPYYFAFSHAISPSGDLVATITFNARDGDLDIVLISTRDGRVLRNITKGFTSRYESIKFEIEPSYGTSLAWSRDGDRLAFFARDGRRHSLFLVSPLTGKTLLRIPLAQDQPAGPGFLPGDGKILFAAFEGGRRDLFMVDLETGGVENLTRDDLYEKAPSLSPDGTKVVFTVRMGTADKIFVAPISNLAARTQMTFGPDRTVCPVFSPDGSEIYYVGDARGAYNIYALNTATGDLRRFTDVRTGNFFPAPLPNEPGKILFSSFNKGAFQLYKTDAAGLPEPAPAPPAEAGPTAPFRPVLSFDLQRDRIEPMKGMGKLYITARPPVDAIVSTDGSIWGGAALAFSDILGDHTFSLMAYQVRDFRSFNLSYLNLKNRFPFQISAFQYTLFYYPYDTYYDPSRFYYQSYKDAIATRKITGLAALGMYPLNKYYRIEASLGFYQYEEDALSSTGGIVTDLRTGYFLNGESLQVSASLVGETTAFKAPYGPAAGHTFRLTANRALPVAESFINSATVEADLRKYLYLGSDFVAAFRWQAYKGIGRDKYLSYYGGNNQVRSANFYGLVGTEHWFLNAELRFPLVTGLNTILGSLGPVRGTLFFDVTRNRISGYPALFYELDYERSTVFTPVYRELEAIGSMGYGLQFFFLGLPVHLDFVKRLEWESMSRPFSFKSAGGTTARFWIGFDF